MMKITPLILLSALFILRCTNGDTSKEGKSTNNLVKIKSDLKIDTAFADIFYKNNNISDSIQKETEKFYKRRQNKIAWFNKNGLNSSVSVFYNQLQNYQYNFSDSSFYNIDLDSLIIKSQNGELKFLLQENKVQQLDLLLTTTFFRYSKKAYGGEAKNLSNLEWFIPRQYKSYQSAIDSLVLISNESHEQIPINKSYFLLKEQLKKYRNIEKKGGFPNVVNLKTKYQIGNGDSNLILVKEYLYLVGDLKRADKTTVFTDTLINAVKHFQQRMGLEISGGLDSMTTIELNKPISFRIKQIMINLERLRWAPVNMEKKYLLINIPEFKLHLFENEKQVWVTNIIVGRSATQTTIFKGYISQIILNPSWGIPASIAKKEVVPRIIRNYHYLGNNNIEVFSGNKRINPSSVHWTQYKDNIPFTFRQKPGNTNALGKIKFLFPNTYDIYLHDTPSKDLFGDTKRDFSHGCIRIENPKILALDLLKNSKVWNAQKINKTLLSNKETTIQLVPSIPIYITYYTAWVDGSGQLNFRNDIYDLDSKLSKEIFLSEKK